MGVSVRQKEKGKGKPWWVFISHNGERKSLKIGDKKSAEKTAEMKNRRAAKISTFLRPILSETGPANIMASVAVSVRQATAKPVCTGVSSNSMVTNFTTPEITEASNPIKKPPRATMSAV